MKLNAAILALLCGTGMCGLHARACAQLSFNVSIDTSGLSGTNYIELSLSDGQVASLGTPDTNNSAIIDNFTFGGGTAGAILPPNIGNASGDITTAVILADGDRVGTADLGQAFTPGSSLTFDVHLTTNIDAGGVPDLFLVRLLDDSTVELPTNEPMGTNGFVLVNLDGPNPTVNAFGAQSGNPPTPVIRILPNANVPEPESLPLLAALGVSGSILFLFRERVKSGLRL